MTTQQIEIPDYTKLQDEGAYALMTIKKCLCTNDKELTDCMTAFAFIKARKKELKEILDKELEPKIKLLHEMHRQATGLRALVYNPWDKCEEAIEEIMRPYVLKKKQGEERKRIELQKVEDEKALQEKELALLEAELMGNAEEVAVIEQLAPIAIQVKAEQVVPKVEGSKAGSRDVWKYRIVNPNAVPYEFRCIDEAKIFKQFRQDGKNMKIPGVEVYQDVSFTG